MFAFFKSNVLFILYCVAILLFFLSLAGKVKWPILFIAMLFPLRNVIEKMHMFPLGKDLIDILVLAIIFGWIISRIGGGRRIFDPSPVNGVAFLLIGYTFFSLLYGSQQLNLLRVFDISHPRVQDWKNFCMLPILFFLAYNNMTDKKWIMRTLMVMCLSMVVMDLYLIRQMTWYPSIVSRLKINGTFVYLGPNEVAAFYNEYTIILISLFLFMRRNLAKGLLFLLIITNLYCVLFLFSRGAYIATVVGLTALFFVRSKKLLIPLIIVVICWHAFLPQRVKARIEMTKNNYGQLDKSSQGRIRIWHESVELFKKNPVLGIGFGVFYYMGYELGDVHNIYLKILTEQGIIGLFIFLLLIIVFIQRGIRLYYHGEDDVARALGLGFACCIIVLLVNNFFGDRWTYLEVSSYLWIFAGLVERLNHGTTESDVGGDKDKKLSMAENVSPNIVSGQVPDRPKRRTYYK